MLTLDVDMPDFGVISDRGVTRALKAAGMAAASWFVEERLMLRFDDISVQRDLGWATRDENYQDYKRRRTKKVAYHKFTGRTRSIVRRQAKPRATRKFVGVRLTGLGPQYKRRKKGSTRIDLRSELGMMSGREQERFAKIYGDELVRVLRLEIERSAGRRSRRRR